MLEFLRWNNDDAITNNPLRVSSAIGIHNVDIERK
jgi:hypothetical protein